MNPKRFHPLLLKMRDLETALSSPIFESVLASTQCWTLSDLPCTQAEFPARYIRNNLADIIDNLMITSGKGMGTDTFGSLRFANVGHYI